MYFKSKGIIRYSTGPSYWVLIDCDQEIGKYYRRLYNSFHYNCKTIRKPSWAEHITVIRDEEPINKSLWGCYNGIEIEFEYENIIKDNDEFYWLDVYCDFLYQIRIDLGLGKDPEYPFHLTVGNKD